MQGIAGGGGLNGQPLLKTHVAQPAQQIADIDRIETKVDRDAEELATLRSEHQQQDRALQRLMSSVAAQADARIVTDRRLSELERARC